MTRRIVAQAFLDARFADMLVFEEDPAQLIARFRGYAPPPPKWPETPRP
jgi:hypothetical protein